MKTRFLRDIVSAVLATVVLVCSVGLISLAGWLKSPELHNSVPVPEIALAAPTLATDGDYEEQLVAEIFEKVRPSVVNVRVESGRSEIIAGPGLDFLSGPTIQQSSYVSGAGSGFVWDREGHIVTHLYLVENADKVEVIFFDGTTVPADVIGIDSNASLAVLKVELEPERLQPVILADSDDVFVGQRAFTISTLLGSMWTVTPGTVGGLKGHQGGGDNQFSDLDLILTNAAMGPDSAGAPLVNMKGELIGVNTQMFLPDGTTWDGGDFAVPSNIVGQVVSGLIEEGEFLSPWLIA